MIERAAAALSGVLIARTYPLRFGHVMSCANGGLRAGGIILPLGGGARIAGPAGSWVPALVSGFDANSVHLLPLDGAAALTVGAQVVADDSVNHIAVGGNVLGRVIDANGVPLDGLGPIGVLKTQPARTVGNPMDKARIKTAMSTGVRAVDALFTLGVGQRMAIVAGSGVGKSTLLAQIMRGVAADVVVVALVGERAREIADFDESHVSPAARAYTVVVAAAADAPAVLRLRAVERATAIAEYFRDAGLSVLLIVDSLTRLAHAQRQIGLAMGEAPTVKGYPPSALALIPALIERAGGDRRTGGSITALYTILADGDDMDDPVVDTARSITDGHIVLSRTLAEAGVFPAIDIARSLSRTMTDVVTLEHNAAAQRVRGDWALAAENRDLVLMGAYRAGADPMLDRALANRPAIIEFLKQGTDQVCPQHETLEMLHNLGAA
ncbi:FliI/YscN family ATPase [Sphingomonas sp.]|uniref:FliI/YscN family ATPase n=1 Tax=Sphingomonas sp. TaxID=28214 RepID=UPI0025F8DEDB|nr:FliI/YscN family ATPase [Sphingomonas sp.]